MTDGDARARWNAKHTARIASGGAPDDPARFLTERAATLPAGGRALDVAGGTGRNALWLAARGFATTLVDVSDAACADATGRAVAAGLPLDVVRAELGTEPPPRGPFDVIVVHHWLDRDVWRGLPAELAPGGVLLLCQPTVRNLERHERPSRRFLLEDGEAVALADAMAAEHPGVQVVEAREGWTDEGRHEAHLVLRRAPAADASAARAG